MAGPYEDPMGGQMPANPGGGGLPGQPRNPATGGYPSRDIAPSPLQPGQMANADLYARSRQNQQWQDMMRRQRFGGMVGGPGMWGGGMFPGGGMRGPRGPVDPGFNIEPGMIGGAMPGQRPGTPIEPDMTSKADELDQYKNGLQFTKNYGGNGGFMGNRPPDWMSEDRAGRIAGRIAGRDPNPKYPGGMPMPAPPPWLNGPPQWGGGGGYGGYPGGGYGGYPGAGGGATPPGGAKPGGPAPQYPRRPDYVMRRDGEQQGLAAAAQQAQSGAQPEPAVYPA